MTNPYLIKRVIIACFLLISTQIISSANAVTLDNVTLQLKWKHQFQFAGYYAAIEQGYYKKAGLKVTLREGQPGVKPVDELVAGRADFSVDMPDMIIDRQKGTPVVALAAIFQHSPLALFAVRNSGISNPQDMIGKKIMLPKSGNAEIFAMFLHEDVKKNQINIIPHSWNVDDLINGKVEASAGYLTDRPFILQKRGVDYSIISPVTYGIDFYGDCLFTTEKEISEHPKRVKNFLAASIKGWKYAMAHPQEMVDLILKKYSTRLSKSALIYESEVMQKLMQPKFIEIGHMNKGRWKHIADTFVELGLISPDYSLKGFLYHPGQQGYAKNKKIIRIILLVAGIITILALILLIFNRRLSRLVAERTRELEGERSFSEAIINALPGHFFMYEDGNRLVRWNKAMQMATGMTNEEIYGHAPLDFIAEKDRARVKRVLKTVFEKGAASVEANVILQDREAPYFLTGNLLERNGKTYLLGMSIDLTERKELEGQLLQAQKMESIGRLAGGIAHDFNNVLTSILGYCELLLAQMAKDAPFREEITIIHSAGNRAAALVRQLLAFSRKQVMKKKMVCLNTIINDLLKILGKTLGEDVVIKTRLEANPGVIEADIGQIEQIIMNLSVNSRDAMPEGGEILIETKDIFWDENYKDSHIAIEPGNYVMLAVSDSGEGMEADVLEHIFDPFYTTKGHGKGTGLGLATVHGIVKQHNGHIFVNCEKHSGTTFKIYFPATSHKVVPEKTSKETAPLKSGSETILIVDDESSVQQLIVDTLEPLGYQCIGATNGEEALAVFKSYPKKIDILLTDVIMPKMNGRELADKIIKEQSDIRVIFMSGYTENTIDHHGVLDKGINYIAKPITPYLLSQKIRSVLDEK